MRICTLFLSLFLLGALTGLQAQVTAESCFGFKTGTFQYLDPDLSGVTVKRTNKKQTETIGKGRDKKSFTFDILWTSPCDYTLTLSEVSDYEDRKMKGTRLYVQIKQTEGDTFTYVSYDDQGNRKEGKVKRIK